MTKRERVCAALKGDPVDRVPYALWQHSTVHQRTVEKFTDFTVRFYSKYDPDLIKVMYDENYDTPVNYDFVITPDVWRLFEEIDPHIGAFGRQLAALQSIRRQVGEDVPVIQTIYSPFHVAHRLAGRRILRDWDDHPGDVEEALNAIASNYLRFAACCLSEARVDGFFFAAFGCEEGWMSEEDYRERILPLDRRVLEGLRRAQILILHIHGEEGTYFRLLTDCPCDALSWEDRAAGPVIAEARNMTRRCLVGGIDHIAARGCRPEEIIRQGREAVEAAGARGLILAPGCTFFDDTPEENMRAVGRAVSPGSPG